MISDLSPKPASNGLRLHWHAADALNAIKQGEYSLDGGDWDRGGSHRPPIRLQSRRYDVTVSAASGREHTIAVRVTDDNQNQSVSKITLRQPWYHRL